MAEDKLVYLDPRVLRRKSNIRTNVNAVSDQELKDSMASLGIQQPVKAWMVDGEPEVTDGSRRVRLAIELGLKSIPVIIDGNSLSEAESIHRQLVMNCQREELPAIDQARAIRELMALTKWNATETGKRLGKSAAYLSKHLALLTLPEIVQQWTNEGKLTVVAAYELTKLHSPDEQSKAARELVEGKRKKSPARQAGTGQTPSTPQNALVKTQLTLSGQRMVTVVGPRLDMAGMLQTLLELAVTLKKEMKRGMALDTFAKLLRDKAQAQPADSKEE